tara:strand:+ start:5054 stop:5221 length:168 start_codon:yes stop_codon:yes gene_type:complete
MEQELLKQVKQFANTDDKMKIVDITDDMLIKISSDQYNQLLQLKKFKWSLQYSFL